MAQESARVHRDGFGCTFLTPAGYTAYRFLGIRRNRFDPTIESYEIKERHQRRGSTRRFFMSQARWEAMMADAQALELGAVAR